MKSVVSLGLRDFAPGKLDSLSLSGAGFNLVGLSSPR
jgi:hypothetical protein